MAEEAKKEAVKEEKKAEPAAEAKTKKISRLKKAEVEATLKEARTHMGGDHSRYVRHLLAKKKTLAAK